jgi:alkylhydroperoxidase family enzyme
VSAGHAARLEALVRAVLHAPGEMRGDLRRAALEAGAGLLAGTAGAADTLPAEARVLAVKVALHPYKVTDEDVEALRRAGWSDNAVFELVVAVAVGAGREIASRGMRIAESA